MRGNKKVDTKPEKLLRSLLFKQGFRFRKNFIIQVANEKCRPDIVFSAHRIAIFVDGCFWHCCPEHGNMPAGNNSNYWQQKLRGNIDRDRRHDKLLKQAGWLVLRIWEHVAPLTAAKIVVQTISSVEHQLENGQT